MSEAKNKTKNNETPVRSRSSKRMIKAVLALVVVSAAGGSVWYFFLRTAKGPDNVIKVSGRIEGDDATVSTKIAGRIREIHVREGDKVTAGQVIALIDDEQVRAREEQEQSRVSQAEARVMSAQQQIAVLEAELERSNIGVGQAKIDAQGRVSQAEAQVAQAEAQLAQAEADFSQAKYDEERYTVLAVDGDV
ncbi:MAG TPA: biotin/lipoyl-binding protein, partial [Pyrinomonadaceae bacterium]